MIENDEKHSAGAKEDGELIEIVVGNHICGYFRSSLEVGES